MLPRKRYFRWVLMFETPEQKARRRDLAARPIAEKLRMLDALRERESGIRGRSVAAPAAATLHEEPPPAAQEYSESASGMRTSSPLPHEAQAEAIRDQ